MVSCFGRMPEGVSSYTVNSRMSQTHKIGTINSASQGCWEPFKLFLLPMAVCTAEEFTDDGKLGVTEMRALQQQ